MPELTCAEAARLLRITITKLRTLDVVLVPRLERFGARGWRRWYDHERVLDARSKVTPSRPYRTRAQIEGDDGAAWRRLYQDRVGACVRAELECELELEDFVLAASRPCWYCGAEPGRRAAPGGGQVTGHWLDRRDDQAAFKVRNVIACCYRCRRMRGGMTREAFVEHARKVTSHQLKASAATGSSPRRA